MGCIKRRQFLQFTGSALAAIASSNLDIQRQGDRYARLLAQSTPRKLALLVGINDYPNTSNFAALKGCVTDVELQRNLLIYSFGFNPKDIVIITDQQATRQGILQAFEEHLIKQAKPGDVVVYHYSGHGSRVLDRDRDNPDGLNSTFVPIDSQLPSGFPNSGGVVQDISGHTLFLLMSAVQTENITVVLDSCFSGGGTRGNFRVRSREGGSQLQLSPEEISYQEQWRSKLNLSPEAFIQQRRAGVAKGVVLASAQRTQYAVDAAFDGFYAGAFTYLMTQYLWQQTGAVGSVVANITRDIKRLSKQVPLADIKPQSGYESQAIYFTDKISLPAEAVITEVKGNSATLWLGGLDRESLAAFNEGAIFAIVDNSGKESGKVKLISRRGLIGEATVLETRDTASLQPGGLLQEAARAIPSDLKLRIGVDASLGSDAAQVKQSLQQINRIEAVNILNEGEVHYILGRIKTGDIKTERSHSTRQPFIVLANREARQRLKSVANSSSRLKPTNNLLIQSVKTDFRYETGVLTPGGIPQEGSIGLFSPGKDEVIPDSFGEAGETLTAAIARLEPKLKSLLAVRIVKQTLNANSSRLNVAVAMTPENQNQLIAEAFTARSGNANRSTNPTLSQQLALGSAFQFRVTNGETRPLYLSILVIDPSGGLIVLFPNQWRGSEESTRLEAGQTLSIPNPGQDEFRLIAQAKGRAEVLIIASQAPLKKALLALQSLAAELKQERGPLMPDKPVEVIGDLLEDLSGNRGLSVVSRETSAADLAALSITFEVI